MCEQQPYNPNGQYDPSYAAQSYSADPSYYSHPSSGEGYSDQHLDPSPGGAHGQQGAYYASGEGGNESGSLHEMSEGVRGKDGLKVANPSDE